jgi:hypothetical protein
MARRVLFLLLVATASACSLLNPLDDFAGQRHDGGSTDPFTAGDETVGETRDGSANDAATDSADSIADSTSTDGGVEPFNLEANGSFDLGCDGWSAYQGTLAHEPTLGRSANGSCMFCTAGVGAYFSGIGRFTSNPPVGTYRATAWVRSAPGRGLPSDVRLTLRTRTNGKTVDEKQGNGVGALSPTWQPLDVTITLSATADDFDVFITAYQAADACVLLDDVSVVRVP